MDSIILYDIIKILRKANREDLVEALEEALDKDYKPPYNYSTDEDCSSGEDESLETKMDGSGFFSIA